MIHRVLTDNPSTILLPKQSKAKTIQKHDDTLTHCKRPRSYFNNICRKGDLNTQVVRCNDCEGCNIHYFNTLKKEANKRMELNTDILQNQEVLLWTLGTNWQYTPENYEKLRRAFTLFRKKIRSHYDVVNIHFYVYEMGSKSGYLHVHFISNVSDRLIQSHLRHIWQSYIEFDGSNENPGKKQKCKECAITFHGWSNVGFKRVKRCKHCKKVVEYYKVKEHCKKRDFMPVDIKPALRYAIKYCSKEYKQKLKRNYYWGNSLKYRYKLKTARVQPRYNDENLKNGYELYTNGNHKYKEIRHISLDLSMKNSHIAGVIRKIVNRYCAICTKQLRDNSTYLMRYPVHIECIANWDYSEPKKIEEQTEIIQIGSDETSLQYKIVRYFTDKPLECYCGEDIIIKGIEFTGEIYKKLSDHFKQEKLKEVFENIMSMHDDNTYSDSYLFTQKMQKIKFQREKANIKYKNVQNTSNYENSKNNIVNSNNDFANWFDEHN